MDYENFYFWLGVIIAVPTLIYLFCKGNVDIFSLHGMVATFSCFSMRNQYIIRELMGEN